MKESSDTWMPSTTLESILSVALFASLSSTSSSSQSKLRRGLSQSMHRKKKVKENQNRSSIK